MRALLIKLDKIKIIDFIHLDYKPPVQLTFNPCPQWAGPDWRRPGDCVVRVSLREVYNRNRIFFSSFVQVVPVPATDYIVTPWT